MEIKRVWDRLAAGAMNIGPSAYKQSMHADATALPWRLVHRRDFFNVSGEM